MEGHSRDSQLRFVQPMWVYLSEYPGMCVVQVRSCTKIVKYLLLARGKNSIEGMLAYLA